MGIGGIGITQLLIILAIVIMLFGTRKIRNLGYDVGGAIKGVREGFKEAVQTADELTPELEAIKDDARAVTRKTRSLTK